MSGQKAVTPSADGLAASVQAAAPRGIPPVDQWNPPFCGDLDIRVARDGTWYYLGSPINRFKLVQLFSSILKKEGDAYFLVTPVEKVGITVEDAPFVATDFDVTGGAEAPAITFTTHVGDRATAGPDNPIRVTFDPDTGEPSPYILIRRNLEALIDRKSFYRLVDLGEEKDGWFGVRSAGTFFPIMAVDALELN